MKTLRLALIVVSTLLLGLGYLMSQVAYAQQWPAEYAAKVDQPAVSSLALVLLIAAIALAFVKEKEEANGTP